MQVDKSRGNDQPARIELLIGAATHLIGERNLGHAAIAQQNIHRRVDLRRRIDQVAALDQQASASSLWILSAQHSALSVSIRENPWLICVSYSFDSMKPIT